MRIVIAGAGVAGGIIARGLAEIDGVDLLVLEQAGEADYLDAGNGLNIGPNALRAAEAVLPDLHADLVAASLPWRRWRAALCTGAKLYEIPLSRVADRPGIRIRWSELYRITRSRLGPRSFFRRSCAVTPAEHATGPVGLAAGGPDGTIERLDADLLIACDGRFSAIREALLGRPAPRHLGVANFRLLVEDGGATGIDDMEQWYHEPHRLLVFRLACGRLYVSGNLPIRPGCDIDPRWKTAEGLRAAYLPAGGGADPRYAFLVDAAATQAAGLHWSRAQEIDAAYSAAGGRVIFAGDSAHAMAPTLGQGATLAIEDACAFVALFRAWHGEGRGAVADLAARFDAARRDRIAFAARLSWEASEPLLLGRDPVATHRAKITPDYEAALRRLYLGGPPD